MSKLIELNKEVDYSQGAIVSKIILENNAGNCTLFAFDEDQQLSEHTAPFDAFLQVVEGVVTVTLDGEDNTLNAGKGIIMPANLPHALHANSRAIILLTMFKHSE